MKLLLNIPYSNILLGMCVVLHNVYPSSIDIAYNDNLPRIEIQSSEMSATTTKNVYSTSTDSVMMLGLCNTDKKHPSGQSELSNCFCLGFVLFFFIFAIIQL